MRSGEQQRLRRSAGFTFVWVLAAIAVLGIGLAALGTVHAEKARREREEDLLRIGMLYAEAIAQYHRLSPGSEKRYPTSIDKLLLDTRFVGTMRHLRKPYADPVSRSLDWGIVRAPDGGLMGIYSLSEEAPLRQQPVDLGSVLLPAAHSYREWLFIPRSPS